MINGDRVILKDEELLRRRSENRNYMLELDSHNLALNYLLEAGLFKTDRTPATIHGGWESPLCELRGHFLGHWLSAAAMHYQATGDRQIKAKADDLVDDLARCQEENGGQWAASIPEKYMYRISIGKKVWAPHYTIHKTFMGLLDMYELAGNEKALEVAVNFGEWFYNWSGKFSHEKFQEILDYETGGMLEIWVILYRITGKQMFRELMERYYRDSLFDGLLSGRDVLTNMHANTTIPEILGAAAWYDATGEEKMLNIVQKYWEMGIEKKGTYATGGQTCGEIWTPDGNLSARLGDKNQEHCTVYNLMRVADFLFRHTGEARFMDFYERNLYNGVMAQAYWRGSFTHGQKSEYPEEGLLTYFLPLRPGARKGWASRTQDFFCCHGSLVQANAALNNAMYYADEAASELYITQYFSSEAAVKIDGCDVKIRQWIDTLNGQKPFSDIGVAVQAINDICPVVAGNPHLLAIDLQICCEKKTEMELKVRVPWWAVTAKVYVDGTVLNVDAQPGSFINIPGTWSKNLLRIEFGKKISVCKLQGSDDLYAFMDGPVVLAGLCDEERTLYTDEKHPAAENLLTEDNERQWGMWMNTWKTVGQDRGIRFIPLYQVGYDAYSVYFPIVSK